MRPIDFPNIVFDLGGVLLNLDHGLTVRSFLALGIVDFDVSFGQLKQEALFDRYERGEVSTAEFRKGLRSMIPKEASDAAIDMAWNAMLLDLPAERLELLRTLSKTKRLALLSNTNELHIRAYRQIMSRQHGMEDLGAFFEKQHYSYEMGMRKPEPRIFEQVLRVHGFKAEETLFIDDSPQHVEGARSVGMKGYHLRVHEGETVLDLFAHLS